MLSLGKSRGNCSKLPQTQQRWTKTGGLDGDTSLLSRLGDMHMQEKGPEQGCVYLQESFQSSLKQEARL